MDARLLSVIILSTVLVPTQQKRKMISVHTNGAGNFENTHEFGLVVTNRNSIIFNVQACHSATIVLMDISSISNVKGHYFLVMIGSKDNTETLVLDSCFRCERGIVVKGAMLDCNAYKPFWMQWDGDGLFKLGKGSIVGRDVHLKMNGKKGTYVSNFILVASTGGKAATFNFTADIPLRFISPAADSSTVVTVNETQPLHSTLLEIKLRPKVPDVVLEVYGEGADHFSLVNRSLRIMKQLDFETKQHYTLIVGSNEGFAVAFTVSVLDLNDETPSLAVVPWNIQEEVPIGTVIGGFYDVTDRDRGDNLTYSLTGSGSDVLIVLGKGQLKVKGRLDRDGSDGMQFDNLTLIVTDLASHKTSAILNVTLTDINDNSPVCEAKFRIWNISEALQKDMVMLNMKSICHDEDFGENGDLSFKVIGEAWVTSSLSIHEGSLIARAGGLDRENFTHGSDVIFFVQVEDNAQRGTRRKTYIQIKVKVLSVKEFSPVWNWEKAKNTVTFNRVIVSSATPLGSVITTLAATDEDNGDNPLEYNLLKKVCFEEIQYGLHKK